MIVVQFARSDQHFDGTATNRRLDGKQRRRSGSTPNLLPYGLRVFTARPRRPSRNRSLFFETEICDFRRDRYRAACSAPLSKPCGPTPRRAFGFETEL